MYFKRDDIIINKYNKLFPMKVYQLFVKKVFYSKLIEKIIC